MILLRDCCPPRCRAVSNRQHDRPPAQFLAAHFGPIHQPPPLPCLPSGVAAVCGGERATQPFIGFANPLLGADGNDESAWTSRAAERSPHPAAAFAPGCLKADAAVAALGFLAQSSTEGCWAPPVAVDPWPDLSI